MNAHATRVTSEVLRIKLILAKQQRQTETAVMNFDQRYVSCFRFSGNLSGAGLSNGPLNKFNQRDMCNVTEVGAESGSTLCSERKDCLR